MSTLTADLFTKSELEVYEAECTEAEKAQLREWRIRNIFYKKFGEDFIDAEKAGTLDELISSEDWRHEVRAIVGWLAVERGEFLRLIQYGKKHYDAATLR